MIVGRILAPALLAAVALLPAAAFATAKLYDMTPLLEEPDPFARTPAPPVSRPAPAARQQPVSATPSQPQTPPPAPARPPSVAAQPAAPRSLLMPVEREPPSDSMMRPVGRLPAGITPQH